MGLALGIGAAMMFGRFVKAFLYGVDTRDALTYSIVIGILGAVALIAAYLPARRASRVDPVVALRYE